MWFFSDYKSWGNIALLMHKESFFFSPSFRTTSEHSRLRHYQNLPATGQKGFEGETRKKEVTQYTCIPKYLMSRSASFFQRAAKYPIYTLYCDVYLLMIFFFFVAEANLGWIKQDRATVRETEVLKGFSGDRRGCQLHRWDSRANSMGTWGLAQL